MVTLPHSLTGMGVPPPVAASEADRVLFLADGSLAGELTAPTPSRVADRMLALTSHPKTPGAHMGAAA